MTAVCNASDPFELARPRLVGLAYRLVGTTADADDVVQEAWLRWQRADRNVIANADAWLTTVVTRLALDHLRRRQREQSRYIGPWLPTPLVERVPDDRAGPEAAAELSDSLTTAFLLLLERLSPDERVAFLLADVFAQPFATIAEVMQRSEAASRQLASRARRKLRAAEQHTPDPSPSARSVVDRFAVALATGDEATALACLGDDSVLISDGGPRRRAARRPVLGPRRILRLLESLHRRAESRSAGFEPAMVGGVPGFVVLNSGGEPEVVIGIEVAGGAIARILLTVNPDKLDAVWRDPATIE